MQMYYFRPKAYEIIQIEGEYLIRINHEFLIFKSR